MGEIFGVMFKQGPKGGMGRALKTMEEKYQTKGVLKGESREKKAAKSLKKNLLKHSIEKVQVNMNKADKVGEKVSEESYKLIMNDLIMLKLLIENIEQIKRMNETMIQRMKKGKIMNIKTGGKIKILEKTNRELGKDLEYIRKQLNAGRTQLEELVAATEGKAAVLLALKRKGFIDFYLVNYYRMKKAIKLGANHVKRIQDGRNDVANAFKGIRTGKITAKDFNKLLSTEKKLAKDARKSASAFFDLFTKNSLVMYIVIKLLRGELKIEYKAKAQFEIPRMMYEIDSKKKKKILSDMARGFRAEHKAVLEEWRMAA